MFTAKLGAALSRPLDALVRTLAHVSPDVLTITGLVLNGVACAFFALAGGQGYVSPAMLRVGVIESLAAAVYDILDGRVARLRGISLKRVMAAASAAAEHLLEQPEEEA